MPETLRKALGEACDPKHNKVLAYYVRRCLISIRESYERRNHEWPPLDLEYAKERVRRLGRTVDMSSVAEPHDVFVDPSHALQLFNKLRTANHSRLMQVLRGSGYEIRILDEFFQSRRAQEDGAIRQIMSSMTDYDAFLNKLELVLKEDESELGSYIDQTTLCKIRAEKQQKDLECLKAAVVEHYCNMIANGEIRPSSRFRKRQARDTTGVDDTDLVRSGRLRSSVTILNQGGPDPSEEI
jgi:hypothetical protein